MKIAQDNGKLWGIFPTAPILAPPQPSFRSTAVLAPPITRSPVAPLNPPTTTPINSALCASVTGVYSQDILFIKNIIKEELSKNIEPLENGTRSYQFRDCVLRNRKYLDNRQMALAFYSQSVRIKYELSDSSKGKFYQIFYPLLKRYKLTENDLSLYKNESELQIQYSKFLDELSKKLNVNVLTDEEFGKSNENKFVWDTWAILRSRFANLS